MTSYSVALARKHAVDCAGVELIDDALYTGICAHCQEEHAHDDDGNVHGRGERCSNAVAFASNLLVCVSHAQVRDAPKDEAEPTVEQG